MQPFKSKCLFAFILLLISTLVLFTYGFSDWDIHTVDTVNYIDSELSLAFDQSGSPGISYCVYNVGLRYATLDGSVWSFQNIEGIEAGNNTALDYDPSNNPAIAVISIPWDHSNIKFVKFDGSVWNSEIIDGTSGGYISLEYDSSGNPCTVYQYRANPGGSIIITGIRFARFNAGTWNITDVNDSYAGYYNSLAFNENELPAISYSAGSGTYKDLLYSYFDGSTWNTEIVDAYGNTIWTSLAFSPNGNPCISYHEESFGDLKYAVFDGTEWSIQVIDSEGDVGEYSSLVFDGQGNPCISYYDRTNGALKFARYMNSSWDISVIDNSTNVGTHTSLAINPVSGAPSISYFNEDNKTLKYAVLESNIDPYISSISPTSGDIGTIVSITGSDFSTIQGSVTFNGVDAAVSSWTDTQIEVTVPDGASTGPVIVHTSEGFDSNSVTFTIGDDPLPTVTILSPEDGNNIKGEIKIQADASDNIGIKSVKFYIDDQYLGYDATDPYEYLFNTALFPDDTHIIRADAYDTSNQVTSAEVTVSIINGSGSGPSVSIISPIDNAEVSGEVLIESEITHGQEIEKTVFYIDNQMKAIDTSSPYQFTWDTSGVSKGSHILKSVAYDTGGQSGLDQISVSVSFGEENKTSEITGMVKDGNTQSPLEGALVEIGILPDVFTNASGMYQHIDVTPGTYDIIISKLGYVALTANIEVPPSSSVVKNFNLFPPKTKIALNYIDSKYNGYMHYLRGVDFHVDYIVNVDWGGHLPLKVLFFTSKGTHEVYTDDSWVVKTINMGNEFDACQTMGVQAISSDGSVSDIKYADFTVISPFIPGLFFDVHDYGDNFSYTAEFNLDFIDEGIGGGVIPEDIPLFGDNSFDLSFIPSVKGTLYGSGDVEVEMEWDAPLVDGSMAGFDFSLDPYINIYGDYQNPNCGYDWSGEAGISGDVEVSRKWYFLFMAGPIPIPMYTKASFNLSADAALIIDDINPVIMNGEVGIYPYVKGSLGAGICSKFSVEGWIGGGADFILQWPETPTLRDLTLYLNGGVSVYAFLFKWETELLSWDWNINQASTNYLTPLFNLSIQPEEINRHYLLSRGMFNTTPTTSFKTNEFDNEIYTVGISPLQTSTLPYSEPNLSSAVDKASLLWLKDNSNRTSINRTMAVFSSYDGLEWTQPEAISDDGTADFHPVAITFSDGTVITAWENENKVMPDSATFEDMKANLEISAAIYDASSQIWEDRHDITFNNYWDGSPKISGLSKDNVMLVWTANDNNDLRGGPGNPNRIYYSIFDGIDWSAAQVIADIPYGIFKYDLAYDGNEAYVVLSLDVDGNNETIQDHELFILRYESGFWRPLHRLTEDNLSDDNPQIALDPAGNFILSWIKDSELSSVVGFDMNSRTIIMTNEYSTNLADFRLTSSPEGKLALMWAEASEFSSDLFCIFYDPVYNTWGNSKQLSFDTETERHVTTAFMGTDTILAVYNRNNIEVTQTQKKALNGKMVVMEQPEIISTDLYMLKYAMGKDLALDEDSFRSLPENPQPGNDVILSADAMNLGDEAVQNVPVKFYSGDPANGGIEIGESVIGGILSPGNTDTVSFSWTIPNTNSPLSIYAVIDPLSVFDPINRSNNKISIKITKSDILIKRLTWNMPAENLVSLTARVSNEGVITSGETTLNFKQDSNSGTLIYSFDVPALLKYESLDFNYEWDVSGISENSFTLYTVVDEDNLIDETNEDNNQKTVIISKETEGIGLNSPNGGERWDAWTVNNITWTASDSITDVKIEYSLDSGANWTDIVSSTTNNGVYSWNVPNESSTQCMIRICDASDGFPSDISDNTFAIVEVCEPVIQQHPQDNIINFNSSTSLSVEAVSPTDMNYQWYQGESGNMDYPVGTDSDMFLTPDLTDDEVFWVRITNDCGSFDSDTATITVLPLSFITEMEDIFIPEGSTVSLGVKLSGEPLSEINSTVSKLDGDADINIESGANLTFSASNWESYQYVTLSASTDEDTLNGQATIRISAAGIENKDIIATELENAQTSPSHYQVIPEVFWAPASGGGTWMTEVFITDVTGGSEVYATFNGSTGIRRGPFYLFTGQNPDHSAKTGNLMRILDSLDQDLDYYGRVGAVEFTTQDPNHKIHVIARTRNGNYSKTFPGLNHNADNTAGGSRIMMVQNLSSNNTYRTAYGGFNPTEESITVDYSLMDKNGNIIGNSFSRTFSGKQFQAFWPFKEAGIGYPNYSFDSIWLKITPVSGAGKIISFCATVNNMTNDPAVHLAIQAEDTGGYNSPSHYQVIPEVMWAPSSGGGAWESEVFITDVTGGSEIAIYYNTFTGVRRGPISIGTFTNPYSSGKAKNILSLLDKIDNEFDYYGTAGALEFTTQDENHKIHVIGRTTNGNYSKTFQGINLNNANTASAEQDLMVQNLVSNDDFRSAFGAFNATAESAEVRFTILSKSGNPIGSSFTKSFTPYRFHAFNPFVEAGLPYPTYKYNEAWIKVEVISGSGQIMAFGSTTNNFTNDPAAHRGVRH